MSIESGAALSNRLSLSSMTVELSNIEEMDVDVLALGVFEDDRPLKGAAGYCDWRLNGRLSSMIQKGWFECKSNETILTDTAERIATRLILMVGQGKRSKVSMRSYKASLSHMFQVINKAKLGKKMAIELPGLGSKSLSDEKAISTFVKVAVKEADIRNLTLVCPSKQFKELVDKLVSNDKSVDLKN